MRAVVIVLAISVYLFGSVSHVLAHGEDKPGPHGGVIRMPGAFHTEIVTIGDHAIELYLLDINWKDPTVKDSTLTVTHLFNEKQNELKCTVNEKHFLCRSESFPLNLGSLSVKARRLGVEGVEVKYPLPLKIDAVEHGHKGMH